MPRQRAATQQQPAIEQRADRRGGEPVIAGTGVRVMDIAARYDLLRMTPDEIAAALPHLTLAQIHAALSYYYAHKPALDRRWKAALRRVARMRRQRPSILERKLGRLTDLH